MSGLADWFAANAGLEDLPIPYRWTQDFAELLSPNEQSLLAICQTHNAGLLIERQYNLCRWSAEICPDGIAIIVIVSLENKSNRLSEVALPEDAVISLQQFIATETAQFLGHSDSLSHY